MERRPAPRLAGGRSAAGLFVSLAVLTSSNARAADQHLARVAMTWARETEADRCIDQNGLQRLTEHALGRPAFFSDRPDLQVDGTIGRLLPGPGWVANMRMSTQDGRVVGIRQVKTEKADCAALDQPLALVLALMIDLSATDIALTAPPPINRPRGWTVDPEIAGVVSTGLLPGTAPGLVARVQLALALPVGAALEVARFARVSTTGPGGGGVFGAWTAAGWACGMRRGGRIEGAGCLGVSVARIDASGSGFSTDYQRNEWVWGPGARVTLRVGLGQSRRFSLEIGAAAAAQLHRVAFVATGGPDEPGPASIYRVGAWAATADLGIGYRFSL